MKSYVLFRDKSDDLFFFLVPLGTFFLILKGRLITPLTYLTYTLRYAYSLSFKTKRIARFLHYHFFLRDRSSTLKAQQLTGCLVPSGWLAKNQKQKATKL
jgi:hypothetical protein